MNDRKVQMSVRGNGPKERVVIFRKDGKLSFCDRALVKAWRSRGIEVDVRGMEAPKEKNKFSTVWFEELAKFDLGGNAADKDPKDMTMEELSEALGYVPIVPDDKRFSRHLHVVREARNRLAQAQLDKNALAAAKIEVRYLRRRLGYKNTNGSV